MEIPVPHAPPPRVAAVRLFVRDNGWILFPAVAYFLAVELGLRFPFRQQVPAAIWPASGVGIAALLIGTRSRWPAILPALFFTGLAADLLFGRPLAASVGLMIANVAESLACAWLISHWCGASVRFSRVNE